MFYVGDRSRPLEFTASRLFVYKHALDRPLSIPDINVIDSFSRKTTGQC